MDSMGLTLGILLAGIVVVVGGILVLRLHAFLALILGALLVGILTPFAAIERYNIDKAAVDVVAIADDSSELTVALAQKDQVHVGMQYVILRPSGDNGDLEKIGDAAVDRFVDETVDGKTIERAVMKPVQPGELQFQPGDIVIHPFDWKAAEAASRKTVGERVATRFGSTCTSIGILIAMASIIGKCLLDSGAADRIVRSALKVLGEAGAPLAFILSGFLLGIPVFFDTVFYLMIPLGKAMTMRVGRNYLLYVLAIVSGATMAHSLVPPTPGPLFVADELGIDIGMMILAGCAVGFFTSGFGYIYATFANRIWELPLRESPGFSLDELKKLSQKNDDELPPTWISLLPILLPVILIGGNTVLKSLNEAFPDQVPSIIMRSADTLGNKNIALAISAAIALGTLVWQKRTSLKALATSVQESLASGGVIILITAGGGAFGGMLQETGVAGLIRELPLGSTPVIISFAFLVTAAVRTAQGSGTVAMITAVGILSGIATSGELGFHPVYLALAIGCGSKPIAWMNDSGFWVIGRMSGMTEAETLKYVTPMTTLMGVVGLAVTIAGATLFPMN